MPTSELRALERLYREFGEDRAVRKLDLLKRLDRGRMPSADAVSRMHEVLQFLHAYPDDAALLERVTRMLERFGRRADLKRHAEELADSGIAGTPIHYAFFWPTVRWLERHWPGRLRIDWEEFDEDKQGVLDGMLSNLMPYAESLSLEEAELTTEEWVDRLRGRDSDTAFVLQRMERLRADDLLKESLFDDLTIPFRLEPGRGGPARTGARWSGGPTVFRDTPLDGRRPDLKAACLERPRAVRAVGRADGRRLVDLAREAMVTRARDLYAFKYADPNDVRIVEFDDGLQFAAMGLLPERRLMLDTVYAFLTMRNGVPMGYVLSSAYFNSVEVAYNVFDTFRGGEAGRIYGKVLAMMHHLFGADAFTVDPYQLGHDNDEGLASGAWWFYYKLGFRPRDAETRRLVRAELAKMKRRPAHRSSLDTLQELSAVNMYWYLGAERSDVRGLIPLERIGLAMTDLLSRRFGADRERGLRECADEAAKLLGVRSRARFSPGERLAWERWAPLVLTLPGVSRWNPAERRALAAVVRAKGGRRETDYLQRFDAHVKLRRALLKLAGV
ncbi:MAG: hypothetical protein GY716_20625 [bacterium]|nr:hypothetical protein [bacterium]